ncbi:MFS transporter [Lactobacillus nasalidis]|uniref:MFS transporter n=1 Tax=Lactobacillus nasalidis TaxID=2797258 RepID=A0ABQ3W2Q6_9LACO|nr:MFS transporter [Lactobacillus nasalidis]GHV97669.1 MFS transporter [Lactobacillus nasalidis]GHV99273.1 MFS transporter [Lactobacillus nasalidis]GHW00603.1 MFS transporter [Lactobacillus nasalidis]
MNKQKLRLSVSLYLNYVAHGFGLLILSQNMTALGKSWSVPLKLVSFVISGVGIGRLLAYLITGYLADKISRKFFVYLGMACYLAFALGIPFSKNVYLAYGLAILAGIANSALDAGTYTTFAEMGQKGSRGNILIKAAASLGEFILPLLVASLSRHQLWFGYSFMAMAAILVVNAILLAPLKFPKPGQKTAESRQEAAGGKRSWLTTVCFALYGYASMALMIWFTQWITLFGQKQGFSLATSHLFLSLYSVGSIIGVFCLFGLLSREVSPYAILLVMNVLATLMVLLLLVSHSALLSELASFMFGLTAASGIMQTGLNAFMELYPDRKGLATGIFYFFGAIASFTVPIITGVLSDIDIRLAFGGDLAVGIIACLLVSAISISHSRSLRK